MGKSRSPRSQHDVSTVTILPAVVEAELLEAGITNHQSVYLAWDRQARRLYAVRWERTQWRAPVEREPVPISSPLSPQSGSVIAFDLGIKTRAVGVNEQRRLYHIGGFKGSRWYNKQLDKIRSKRDRCKRGSRRYRYLSQVYKHVSERKHNKQRDSLHKASHLIAHTLVERTVVVGDLSQRQMVTNEHQERNKYRNRAVYNEWFLYTFLQMLMYKCQLSGKDLQSLDERNTSKQSSQCGHLQPIPLWKRTYRCAECGLVRDRDEKSAVNILMKFLARLEPHTDDSVRCAAVFTAIDHVLHTLEHM